MRSGSGLSKRSGPRPPRRRAKPPRLPVPSEGGDGSREKASEASAPAVTRLPLPPPAAPVRRPPGQAQADIEAVLPRIPEVFEKRDLVRAIGYEPSRATMLRVIADLLLHHRIKVIEPSDGRLPTKYRKIPAP